MHKLYMNLDYGSVRASKIAQEGIENNPVPNNYAIKKAVEHHIIMKILNVESQLLHFPEMLTLQLSSQLSRILVLGNY